MKVFQNSKIGLAGNQINKKIKNLAGQNLSLFLYANILYSFSTGLIIILSPYIIGDELVYEEFIYNFQNILFLTGIFTAGLTTALLRYYKFNHQKYECFYNCITLIIYFIVLIFGLFVDNPITTTLHLYNKDKVSHFVLYLSIMCSLMYIFNRALSLAQERFKTITFGILLISVLRIVALFIIAVNGINNIAVILLLICVFPMSYELITYSHLWIKTKKSSTQGLFQFIFFMLRAAVIGSLYMITNRILVVTTKSYDSTLAASLSFAYGVLGIINILNTTLSNYYLAKLDGNNEFMISDYLKRIKHSLLLLWFVGVIVAIVVYLFVMIYYPSHSEVTAILSVVTIMQSFILFQIGLVTLLVKVYDMLNMQIIINIVVCIIVYLFVHHSFGNLNIVFQNIGVALIVCSGEIVLMCGVLIKHHKKLLRLDGTRNGVHQ